MAPIWFWNGVIEEGELARQIREIKEKGLGGFCLAPGSGLRIPYLSRIWFDRARLALETARKEGLKVWLYDEYPYPGDMSGGRVALGYPQYRAQYLTFRETTVQGGQQVDMELPWTTVLRAIAVPLKRDRCLWEDADDIGSHIGANQRRVIYRESSSETAYHPVEYLARGPVHRLFWKAPAGRWRVLVFLQRECDTPGSGGTHFDPFNPEAVARFLDTTYGLYAEPFGNLFGNTIPGIITAHTPTPSLLLPWSPRLPDVFRERNGYDLLKCLPALISGFGPNTSRIRYDYFQTLSELQRDSFHSICDAWCTKHGIAYAANIPIYRNIHRQNVHIPGSSGGREKLSATGIDADGRQAAAYHANPLFAASLARQTGRSGPILNTTFNGTGWSLTLQDMKWTIDRLANQGCTFFNLRGFFYTLDGLRKHNAPPSLFHQNPYWKHFRLLADYAGRLSYALSSGRPVADIALLDPVTSLWAHLGHPGCNWHYLGHDPDEEKLTARLVEDWAYVMVALSQMQRQYECLDPQHLNPTRIEDGRLHIGNASYSTLIIPPITNLERNAFECIRQLINEGGNVIFLGLLPIEDIQEGPSVVDAFSRLTDMEPGRMIRDYTGHELGVHLVQRGNFHLIRTGGSVAQNQAARVLADLLDQMLPQQVRIQTDKQSATALLCHQREDDDGRLYFLSNTSQAAFDSQIGLQLPSSRHGKTELWDLETGRRTPIAAQKTGNQLTVSLRFERLQSHLLVVSEGEPHTPETRPVPDLSLDTGNLWKIDPEEDNALRLDSFRMQFDPQNRGIKQGWHKTEYSDSRWQTVSPKPVGEQIREAENLYNLPLHFPPDASGQPPRPEVRLPLVCWYRAAFVADVVPSKLALVMDRGAILGNYQIYLNGSRLPNNAFRPTFRYDHANVTCAVGRRVSKGRNVLAVRVEVNDLSDGLVDAFYLFGRFGVKSWRSACLRLVSPIDRGPLDDLDGAWMPFYAGTVAYSQDLTLSDLPETERVAVSLEKGLKNSSDIVEVLINGHSLGVRAWAPYAWTGETAHLKKGKNRVVIRITTPLARLLTGQHFNEKQNRMVPVKI